jgi:hypothetical protein
MTAGKLVLALITSNPHELLVAYRQRLLWAAKVLDIHASDDGYGNILKAVLEYDKRFGKCPDSFATLREFVELDTQQDNVRSREIVREEINTLEGDKDSYELPSDPEVLMDAVFKEARAFYYEHIYKNARAIALGAKAPKGMDETGPDVSEMYVRQAWAAGFKVGPPRIAGSWTENADEIGRILDDHLVNSEKYRIYTGFAEIDRVCAVGPKYLKWIGILGYTNHGKSAFLLAMLYNMARAGHRILFIPREASVEETWLRLTFMHKEHFPKLKLCSLNTWIRSPHLVTPEDRATRDFLLADLKNRTTIKGGIDVQAFNNWEQIMDHLEANKARWQYDVLAVDYLSHLEVEGRDQIEAKKALFRKAQMLTHDFNGGAGLVVITPLQANKQGHKEAQEQDGDEWGTYKSPAAVEWFTQAAQDMDLLFSVWHQDRLKETGEMIVHCVKVRGEYFKTHSVKISPLTRMIHDKRDVKLPEPEKVVEKLNPEAIAAILGQGVSVEEVSIGE